MGLAEDMRAPVPDVPEEVAPTGDSPPEVKFVTRIRCMLRTLDHIAPAFCAIWKECALPVSFAARASNLSKVLAASQVNSVTLSVLQS